VSQLRDVFLSYRWSEHDSKLTRLLCDRLRMYTLSNFGGRALSVFLDTDVLEPGSPLQAVFIRELLQSLNKSHPAFSEAWMVQGALWVELGKDTEAQQALLRYIELEKTKKTPGFHRLI
jgi:hypothetical protein